MGWLLSGRPLFSLPISWAQFPVFSPGTDFLSGRGHRQGVWRFASPLARVCLSPLSRRSWPTRTGVSCFPTAVFGAGNPCPYVFVPFPKIPVSETLCHLLSSYLVF